MRAWVWVAIIAWVLFMVTYVWGLARASSREMPPYGSGRRGAQLIDTTGLPDGYDPPSASLGPPPTYPETPEEHTP
jgi:hypothetical protein